MKLLLTLIQILTRLAAPVAAFFWAKNIAKNERVENDLEQAKHDAQAWADSPGDYVEFDSRLHELAARKRKDNPEL